MQPVLPESVVLCKQMPKQLLSPRYDNRSISFLAMNKEGVELFEMVEFEFYAVEDQHINRWECHFTIQLVRESCFFLENVVKLLAEMASW